MSKKFEDIACVILALAALALLCVMFYLSQPKRTSKISTDCFSYMGCLGNLAPGEDRGHQVIGHHKIQNL